MNEKLLVKTLMTLHHGPSPHPFKAGAEIHLPLAEANRLIAAGLVEEVTPKSPPAPS